MAVQSLRFENSYVCNEFDPSGIKFNVRNDLGIISEFGDFVSSDLYLAAELIAEYQPRLVSVGFYNTHPDFYEAAKQAAREAGIEFVCTAG